jgi:NAD(P)H-dependent FMN reductase
MPTGPVLQILIASTRPGRVGLPIARWFESRARAHGTFEIDVADLLEIGLPLMDEPRHPRFRDYQHQHTRDWSARVGAADAFVFVMPEYNHGFNAPLKNALDYLSQEWAYKPVSFVSYGGVAGGTRAVQMLKPVLAGLRMTPIFETVAIPMVFSVLKDGELQATEPMEAATTAMLTELERVEHALRPLRVTAAAV